MAGPGAKASSPSNDTKSKIANFPNIASGKSLAESAANIASKARVTADEQTILNSLMAMHKKKGCIVSQLDPTQIPALARVCSIRRLADGEKFYHEGDVATSLGLIMSGRIRIDNVA
eukprot:CAMPEP_0114123264 /NCGR_PEP_ID=MMETSP0043_2-20121206/8129_1 /TAXON_ID=464988 /ORGANISM="Hemiselmis andersenii, Strain CCMP644" /LENGTH=116 /DNA_ID=CAMNT_0001216021 /DNA_START=103 /DNA_END=450 /DNA_ORIENTATION=+